MRPVSTRAARPITVPEIIREVLALYGKTPERCRDRSALVFERDSVGRLVLRYVAVLPLAKNLDCERCGQRIQQTRERLCLPCAKEVFGA